MSVLALLAIGFVLGAVVGVALVGALWFRHEQLSGGRDSW